MSDYFPEEVLLDLLARLPVKTVLQCTSVCKTWRSLIAGPDFTTHHFNNYSKKNDFILLRYRPTRLLENNMKEHYFLYSDEGFLSSPVTQLTCPVKKRSHGNDIDIVGCINGLICLSDNSLGFTDTFAMWNPSVRKHVITPKPSVILDTHGPHSQLHGFGFDDAGGDYKLVRIVYVGRNFDKVPPFVEVYSLKNRHWRLIENDLSYVIFERHPSVFVNGMSHWLAHAPDCAQIGVVPFAFGSESFGKMMTVPGSLDWEDYINMSVTVCNGLLALVSQLKFPKEDSYSVWVMKEYGDVGSWSKLYTFKQRDRLNRVVSFRKNEEIVLVRAVRDRFVSLRVEEELVTLDLQTNAERNSSPKRWGLVGSFYMDSFLESLVLLNEPNVASDEKDGVVDRATAASRARSSDSSNQESSFLSLLNTFINTNPDSSEFFVNALRRRQ